MTVRQSLRTYIDGGISAAEGYANLMGRLGARRAGSRTGARSSGS